MDNVSISLICHHREAEDEKKQRAEIERRRKEEEALVAKYLEAERIKADEVRHVSHLSFINMAAFASN